MAKRRVLLAASAAAAFAFTGFAGAIAGVLPVQHPVLRVPMQDANAPIDPIIHFGPQTGKIEHVIFVMQENRSFDDLFQGFPKADTKPYGYNHLGQKVTLQPIPLEAPYDIEHFSSSWFQDYDGGKMDGFDLNGVYGQHNQNAMYGYVPYSESKPYFDLARAYVLGDRTFTSHIDASFVSHQYLIAGQAAASVDLPGGAWGCSGGRSDQVATITAHYPQLKYGPNIQPCYNYVTIANELDAKKLAWRFYAAYQDDGWSAYQAINNIYNNPSEWNQDVIGPNTQFFSDVKSGFLGSVTWITPTCYDSDHGGCDGNGGPAWVTSIVNAVGESKFWDTTAVFVMWDEWGGWYDHVKSPIVDYDGLGFRVPLLIISPYAKEGYVSHVQYEHGSVLKFIEDTFGLHRLSHSDTRANSPATDAFDFNQKPRKFKHFGGAMPQNELYYRLPEIFPVDAE